MPAGASGTTGDIARELPQPSERGLTCRRLARLARFPSPGSEVGAPAGAAHPFAEPSLAGVVHAERRPAAAATAWEETPRPFAGLRGARSVAVAHAVPALRLVEQTRSPAAGHAPLAAADCAAPALQLAEPAAAPRSFVELRDVPPARVALALRLAESAAALRSFAEF